MQKVRRRLTAGSCALALVISGAILTLPTAVAAAPLEAPPTEIPVAGELVVFPTEHGPTVMDAEGNLSEPELSHHGATLLLTESGHAVDVSHEVAASVGELATGQTAEALLGIPPLVQDAMSEELAEATPDQSVDIADLALAAASELDVPLDVLNVDVAETPTAAFASSHVHTVDVVVVSAGNEQANRLADVDALVQRLGAFWKSESGGQVSGFSRLNAQFIAADTAYCGMADDDDLWDRWDWAAKHVGTNDTSAYVRANSAAHLVVLESKNACGRDISTGLGSIGSSIRSGGVVWGVVDLQRPTEWDQVAFHEIGHNVSLLHSNVLACTGGIDTERFDASGIPVGGDCTVRPYWDFTDVMGGGLLDANGAHLNGGNIAALNATHRHRINALPEGTGILRFDESNGVVQTVDLRPSTDANGARALIVADPVTKEQYVLDYRAGIGRDAQSIYMQAGIPMIGPGVRVMRYQPDARSPGLEHSVLLLRKPASGNLFSNTAHVVEQETFTSYSGELSITFIGRSAGAARLEIRFGDPPPTISLGTVTVSGTAQVGQTLTASPAGWKPAAVTFTHQWLRDGGAISGGTGPKYVLQASDEGMQVSVRVTAALAGAQSVSMTSAGRRVLGAPYVPPTGMRISGADRFATAVAVSKHAYPKTTGGTVIVATGMDYPDSLSAAPLGAKLNAPLLLTHRASLPGATAQEIARLKPRKILVIGGEGAVSGQVRSALAKLAPTVQRIAGADRYATSLAVVRAGWKTSDDVFIATGTGFADALSAGAAAGSLKAPVVLVPGNQSTASSGARKLLTDLQAKRLHISGGTAAVSNGMARSLTGSRTMSRYSGADRFATSAAVAKAFHEKQGGTYLANGYGFPDALTGAAVAGTKGAPLLLSRPHCIPSPVRSAQLVVQPKNVHLLGGTGALSREVAQGQTC